MSEFNLGDKPTQAKQKNPTRQETPEPLKLTITAETSTENVNQLSTPPIGGSNPDTAPLPDFDNAPLPDDETQAQVTVGEGARDKVTSSGMMTYEAFDQLFCTTFLISGHATGFKTLTDAPALSSRPDATRAMYDAILDTPALHFIINPQSLWMQRAFAMGAFFVPVSIGVANELRERRLPSAASSASSSSGENPEQAMRNSLKGR